MLLQLFALAAGALPAVAAQSNQCYKWQNVRIGGGGGFVPGIIFNPTQKGLAYARTDIGGAYRLNPSDHTWIPLQDEGVKTANWGDWYIDSLATDPVDPRRLYLLAGAYTNGWDPNNASVLVSTNYGTTFKKTPLPFKGGGNQPGRGIGERLAIDPNRNSILFLGTRSGNGLWKSTNYGASWSKVESFTAVGTYAENPSDPSGYAADNVGVTSVTFDPRSSRRGVATKKIYVTVADKTGPSIFVSNDAGSTWSPLAGQPEGHIPHKLKLSTTDNLIFVTYTDGAGPYDGSAGSVYRYNITDETWKDINPSPGASHGYGGFSLDAKNPGTIMVAALNKWWPDTSIYRSKDYGETWTEAWTWGNYPQINNYYTYDVSSAPWLYDPTLGDEFTKFIGWMIESLEIDPHDSNHFLYGTGATIFGSRDLTRWDTERNFTVESLATGVEETAILGLAAPKQGPPLLSAVGDIVGFVHFDLNKAPQKSFSHPTWPTSSSIDYAGNEPQIVVRVGQGGNTAQLAVSHDSGVSWFVHPGAPEGRTAGKAVISAGGNVIVWGGSPVLAAVGNGTFESVDLPDNAVLAADKVAPAIIYAASGSSFFVSNSTGAPAFEEVSTLAGTIRNIGPNPYKAGDLWVATSEGLFRSKDYGKTFAKTKSIDGAWAVAVGGSRSPGGEPIVFATASHGGKEGVYRSTNGGARWQKIDGRRGFGSIDSLPLAADPRKYGRLYLGTNGRGIFYADAC